MKVKCDAALFRQSLLTELGWVASDFNRRVIGAVSKVVLGYLLPAEVEALSIKETLNWIKRHNWSNICIESDAL